MLPCENQEWIYLNTYHIYYSESIYHVLQPCNNNNNNNDVIWLHHQNSSSSSLDACITILTRKYIPSYYPIIIDDFFNLKTASDTVVNNQPLLKFA